MKCGELPVGEREQRERERFELPPQLGVRYGDGVEASARQDGRALRRGCDTESPAVTERREFAGKARAQERVIAEQSAARTDLEPECGALRSGDALRIIAPGAVGDLTAPLQRPQRQGLERATGRRLKRKARQQDAQPEHACVRHGLCGLRPAARHRRL